MNEKLNNFIQNSFIGPLLEDSNITDVSYNGVSIFYMHNKDGRKKSDIKVSPNEAMDFIRQIANFTEKQFSFATPSLDVSIGKYRLNAMHTSIVRVNNEKSCSFSLRIASQESKVKDDLNFLNKKCRKYLKRCLDDEKSIVIAGPTGSGKTELQKYLLSLLRPYSRVIVIDNIQELESVRVNNDLDLTSWQISPNNENATIEELIRNALRSNPDWLVVAEARGKEMADVLNSVMTGHPIITTLHAKSVETIPKRMARMILKADGSQKYEEILEDISDHMKVFVYVNRRIKKNGKVARYVESIAEFNDKKEMEIVFRKDVKWIK